MGYRWHNGRLVSDKEYEEEQINILIGAAGATPALLIGWLVGGYFGANYGIGVAVVLLLGSIIVWPVMLLIGSVIWALAFVWGILVAIGYDVTTSPQRHIYHFAGKKTEFIVGTVELYNIKDNRWTISPEEEYFEKVLRHVVFEYEYETDNEKANEKFRINYKSCIESLWPDIVKFGRMHGFNVRLSSDSLNDFLRRVGTGFKVGDSRKSYVSIGSYSLPTVPRDKLIFVSCSHESKLPNFIRRSLEESGS